MTNIKGTATCPICEQEVVEREWYLLEQSILVHKHGENIDISVVNWVLSEDA